METKEIEAIKEEGPEVLLCLMCSKAVTDPEKLKSPGARHMGIVLCSFECAQEFTCQTGCC